MQHSLCRAEQLYCWVPMSCCGGENSVPIFYTCLTPHIKAPLNNHFIQSKELFMLRLLPPFAQCVCMKSAHSETSLEWGLLSYSSCTAISLSINTVSPDFQPALTGPWEPGNVAEAAEAEERGPKDRWKTRATSHWSESVSFISFGVGYKLKTRPPAGTS